MPEPMPVNPPSAPFLPPAQTERPIGPGSRASHPVVVVAGALLVVIGITGVPVSLFAALMSANPCGAFGDHCAQYGQTSDAASGFVGLALLSGLAAVAGFALLIGAAASRPR
jgi:hypothetical protein